MMMKITPWALAALLMLPLWAAAEEEKENRWEKAIWTFEQKDAIYPPEKGQILFLGSSSILFWDLKESFGDIDALNRGFGGSTIADSIHFFDRVVTPYEPRQIVFYAGDNDIDRGMSADEVVADFTEFANRVHEEFPDTEIVYIPIKPSVARWKLWPRMADSNEQIAKMAEERDWLTYVDMASPMLGGDGKPREDLLVGDGLHLNKDGYKLWTEILRPYLDIAQ
jgi:lysophospholipase L1-like esterase